MIVVRIRWLGSRKDSGEAVVLVHEQRTILGEGSSTSIDELVLESKCPNLIL